jgi:hypothetical protein
MVSDGTLTWPGDTSKVREVAARQFEISVWQSVANATWGSLGNGQMSEEKQGPGSLRPGYPWSYFVETPIRFVNGNKDVVPGFIFDAAWINYGVGSSPSDSLAHHFFDDASPNLGISITDLYLSRNGWAIPVLDSRW